MSRSRQPGPRRPKSSRPLLRPTAGQGGRSGLAALQEGVNLHRSGRLDAARSTYESVLRHEPNQPDALHLLGIIHHQQGGHEKAADLIRRAMSADRANAAYANSLGSVLLALGRTDQARAAFRQALDRQPGYAEAYTNLGNVDMREDRVDAAIAAYRRALQHRPDYPEAHNNLGAALARAGDSATAEASYRAALALRPGYASAWANLGQCLTDQGRFEEALDSLDRAVALQIDHPDAHANRGICLLTLGRFREGWREYEWRWRTASFSSPRRDLGKPAWDGSDLAGRTLFLQAEQGIGSAIQFARYAPLAAATGGQVILECRDPLKRLFETLKQPSTVRDQAAVTIVTREDPSLPPIDVQATLMSLPGLMGTDAGTIPADVPYLVADGAEMAEWQHRLHKVIGTDLARRRRVGIVWSGNPEHANDRNRSMPASALAPLAANPAVHLYSLQVGPRAGDVRDLPADAVTDLSADLGDFAATAAVIMALDLVISVDTAVAHLAGALARPVWLLVPAVPEWRWQRDREDSPWYPTMRLFRQRTLGDWPELISRVAAALERLPAADGGVP